MYTIYKQGFLFTEMNDNWEWKHLVPNGNPSCMTFHYFTMVHDQIFFIWSLNGMGYKVGWDLSGMGYKVGWSRQIPLKWTNTHFEFEHFVLGALQNSICISSSPL